MSENTWYDEIPQLTITTKNHADNFNQINNRLFNNTKVNKEGIEKLVSALAQTGLNIEEIGTVIDELKEEMLLTGDNIKDLQTNKADSDDLANYLRTDNGNVSVASVAFGGEGNGYIYTENGNQDLCIRGGNSTEGYTYLSLKPSGAYINGGKVYSPSNKPTASDVGALPQLDMSQQYAGMVHNNGSTGNWIRTTESGFIPYANGQGSLGTSTWAFGNVYANNVYANTSLTIGSASTADVALKVKNSTLNRNIILTKGIDANGCGVFLSGGGLTAVGGGEACETYVTSMPDGGNMGSENLVLLADQGIIFRSGVQSGFTDTKKVVLSNTGALTIGSSTGNVRKTTTSTASPSGGSNGDVWIKYS